MYRIREDGTRLCGECKQLKQVERFCPSTDKKRSYAGLHKVCDDCKTRIATRTNESGRMCTECREYKKWTDFAADSGSKHGYATKCKACRATYHRTYHMAKTYGLSSEQYQEMYDAQNGQCPICLGSFPTLVIDHCHTTGEVRGLLCSLCNTGIGGLRDDTDNMRRAIKYLGG